MTEPVSQSTDAIDYAEVLALHAEVARGAGLDGCRVKPWLLEGAAAEIERLRAALAPFAKLADTWTVQSRLAHGPDYLLTLSNGERMCGIEAGAFKTAKEALTDAG